MLVSPLISICFCAVMSFVALGTLGARACAQSEPATITILERAVADGGAYTSPSCPQPVGYRIFETATAVNGDYQMEVSISGFPDNVEDENDLCGDEDERKIRYAYRDSESTTWTSGFLRPLAYSGSRGDPSIVPGPGVAEFLIVALGGGVYATIFNAALGTSTEWTTIYSDMGAPSAEKPWVVRASSTTYHVLFYLLTSGSRIHIRSTFDGGVNWSGSPITVAPNGDQQGTACCPQPALHVSSQSLFVAHNVNGDIGILRRVGDASSTVFERLINSSGSSVITRIEWYTPGNPSIGCMPMPHPENTGTCSTEDLMDTFTVPYLTADPTSATRLYLAHNDHGNAQGIPGENTDPSDIDVVVRRIERTSTNPERWDVTSTVRVPHCVLSGGCTNCTFVAGDPCQHPDAPQGIDPQYPDQFCPAIVVDRFGRVHMIFYSNALTCGITTIDHTYDAYYALSTDHGASFSVHNLRTCAQRPALNYNFALTAPPELLPSYSPREYIGIAVNDDANDFTYVVVSYCGTAYGANNTVDRSAIYAQTIKVTNP